MFERGDTSYYKNDLWTVLASMDFEEFTGEIETESDFGPKVNLTATVSFDKAHLMQLAQKKQDYLTAANDGQVDDSVVVDSLTEDIAAAFDIVFNRVGPDYPPEGMYEKVNDKQWKRLDSSDYYSRYRELLRDLTEDTDGIPSIPELYRPFLLAVVNSDSHELPPEGVVDDILSEHIDSLRSERQSREGVSKLKRELEQRGVNARTAASVANSMEKYLKPDAELTEED